MALLLAAVLGTAGPATATGFADRAPQAAAFSGGELALVERGSAAALEAADPRPDDRNGDGSGDAALAYARSSVAPVSASGAQRPAAGQLDHSQYSRSSNRARAPPAA